MESIIAGGLISLSSFYLFQFNQKNFESKNSILEKLKKNLIIVNTKQDTLHIPDNTPIFISNKYRCDREIWDQNLNIYFESPVIYRKVIMHQIKEKDKSSKSTDSKDKQEKLEYIWSESYQKGRDNPQFPFSSKKLFSDKMYVGPFEFDSKFISEYIDVNTKYKLANKQCDGIPVPWIFSNLITTTQNGNHYGNVHSFWDGKFKIVADGELGIIAGFKNKNTVGDVKITYFMPGCDDLTILGAKQGNTLTEYKDGDRSVFYVKNKKVSLKQVFSDLERNNSNYYLGFNILIGVLMLSGVGLGLNGIIQMKNTKRS